MAPSEQPNSARTISTILNVISVGLFLLCWFPTGEHWAVNVSLAALPVVSIGLLALTNGAFRFGGLRRDPEPSVSLPFVIGGIGLFLITMRESNILPLPLTPILVPVLILGSILTLIVVVADRKTREGIWALVFAVATLYSFGVVVEVNRYFDLLEPKTFQVEVLKKHYHSGRGGTIYYLRVAPWGQFSGENDVNVPPAFYDFVSTGQTVCINLHSGALNIAWYDVTTCR